MKLGLLADIHEDVERLRVALERFRREAVDQVVVLGDVAEMNRRLGETCQLLLDAGAIGVWGNHDYGFSQGPGFVDRYAEPIRQFMPTLKPCLEMDRCLFSHIEPWLDATDMAQLWHYEGLPRTAREVGRSFAVTSARLLFVGHFHRWMAATAEGDLAWGGAEPLRFEAGTRYFVAVGALCNGASGILDLSECVLWPYHDP